jgi:hypothetical protein
VTAPIYDYSGVKKEITNLFLNKKLLFLNTSKLDGAVNMAECVIAIKEVAADFTVLDASHFNNHMKKNRLKFIVNFIESLQVKYIFLSAIDKKNYKRVKRSIKLRKNHIALSESEANILKIGLMNSSADNYFFTRDLNMRLINRIYQSLYVVVSSKDCDTIITYNGRFLVPSIIYILSKRLGKDIYFIEGGAQQESYEFYNISPHSQLNRAELALTYWKYANRKSAEIQGKEYLKRRTTLNDPQTLKLFQSRFNRATDSAALDKYKHDVVFYLSSLWELPSINFDSNQLFPDQETAILTLQKICSKNKLILTIKIHPNPHNLIFEKHENNYWVNFLSKHQIKYISAFDPINTYDLMKTASKNIVYESSVGAECVALNLPVIALVKSDWTLISKFPIPKNMDEVEDFLLNPSRNLNFFDLIPYFSYLQFGGIKYESFSITNSQFLYKNSPIFKGAFALVLAISKRINNKR